MQFNYRFLRIVLISVLAVKFIKVNQKNGILKMAKFSDFLN
jgi:hypothetical protein